MCKTGRKNKVYSAEFKIGVIMDMREHHLSYSETVRKYNLGKQESGGTRNMLQKWERIYLEEGAEGLMKERRGRARSAGGTRKGRAPKLDKKVEEDLIAENQLSMLTHPSPFRPGSRTPIKVNGDNYVHKAKGK